MAGPIRDQFGITDFQYSLLQGAAFVADFDLTELQDQLLSFAVCLREQGVDVDDPDFSALGGGGGAPAIFGDRFDPDDPANADAIGVCQREITIGQP